MKAKRNKAFTLIELLITTVLMVVILSFAIPSFQSIIQNNRSISMTNDLIASLLLARSEAIKRGVSVSVCAAQDSNYNSCGNNWALGWIVFVNPDENASIAGGSSEPIIRVHQITNSNVTIATTPSVGIATYNNQGFAASGTSNLNFAISADGCSGNNARNLSISVTGRIATTNVNCS